MVFFSIIVPVFNREDLIKSTIDSIVNQKYLDYEIIVVDDGSTDLTIKTLEKYGDRITVLHQDNKGPGAARNLGITHATGEYITFLDSDDLWFSWTLSVYREAILKYDCPAFITGKEISFSDDTELESIQFDSVKLDFFQDYYSSSKQPLWLLPGGVVVKSNVLREVGGFTNKWINGEDSDLWLKLGITKGFVCIQSSPVLAYRRHDNSAISNNSKTYAGAWNMTNKEKEGLYPGGKARQLERLEIMMRHIRPVSLAYLREGKIKDGWEMYRATFIWNLFLKRFVYLLVFLFILNNTFWKKIIFNSLPNLRIKYLSE